MIIYTDGATSNNGYDNSIGGWAFVVVDEGKVISEDSGKILNSTNNICELVAVIKACQSVDPSYCYTIFSDSAYIINCYKQKWYKRWQQNGWLNSKNQPVANKEFWEQLIPFFEKENFIFEKVSGHSGDFYNELVDKMAVKAKEKKECG